MSTKLTFDPSTVIMTMDDPPMAMRAGPVMDMKSRVQLAKLRGALAAAGPGEKPILAEQLADAEREAMPKLTVGRAAINALTSVIEGDDKAKLDGAAKLDFMERATRIQRALIEGGVATFSHEEAQGIKERVNAAYPSAVIVSAVFTAFVAAPPEPAAKTDDC